MYLRSSAEIRTHNRAEHGVREIGLKLTPRSDAHFLKVGLAQARLAEELAQPCQAETVFAEAFGEGQETFVTA